MNKDMMFFTINKVLKSVVGIFISTFFSMYFFTLVNYEILPMAKYYIMIYIFLPLSFFVIRKAIKKNIKLPYYRIGISMMGVYLGLILLLKEKISDYILLVGAVYGISEGLYYYPSNVFDAEKIKDEDRGKYLGLINTVGQVLWIIVPVFLGALLSKFDYVMVGKFWMLFIIFMFINSFFMRDVKYKNNSFNIKKFKEMIKSNKKLKLILGSRVLEGLTYSASVLNVVVNLYSIIYLKGNLYYGIFNGVIAAVCLITTTIYAFKNSKRDKEVSIISAVLTLLTLGYLIVKPSIYSLVIYSLVDYSFLVYVELEFSKLTATYTNSEMIKGKFEAEYHFILELFLNIGRIIGYVVLVFIGFFGGISSFKIILVLGLVSYLWLIRNLLRINKSV